MWCVYTHNGILLSLIKDWNNDICSNIDGPKDYSIKWKKYRQRQIYDITYMHNLKI